MDLLELRQQIDVIDSQIVDLYEKRMDVSRQVAEYKISTGKKVFDKQSGSPAFFKLSHHFIKSGAIHGNAGNTVVNEGYDICIAHILGGFGQQLLLVADAVAFTFQVIITGQAGVNKRGNVACFLVVRLFHRSSFSAVEQQISLCFIFTQQLYRV